VDRRGTLVKAVLDTNVVVYLLLGTEQYVDEARSFLAVVSEAQAPAVWEAELANVLWMATRHKVLTIQDAISRLTLAVRLGIHTVPNRTLWPGALVRTHATGLPLMTRCLSNLRHEKACRWQPLIEAC
jgi:predicted nucleic acid-binding protein